MAQVYAAKKGTSWLRRNALKIAVVAFVLYAGYRVQQGLANFKLPMFGNPFENFKLPDLGNPFANWMFPAQPNIPMMQNMMNNQTPNMGTGLIDLSDPKVQEFIKMLTMQAGQMMMPLRMGESFFDAMGNQIVRLQESLGLGQKTTTVNPMQYAVGETNVPRNPQELMKMGLAIDMPSKMGMATMVNKVADALSKVRVTVGSMSFMGTSLTGLFAMNPDLTASQLADLRSRILMDTGNFNFGTNTGSGRQYMFDDNMMVIGSTRNPVLQAYEAYRAQYA